MPKRGGNETISEQESSCEVHLALVSREMTLAQISRTLGLQSSIHSCEKGALRKRVLHEPKPAVWDVTIWETEPIEGKVERLGSCLEELLQHPAVKALQTKRNELGNIGAEANVAIFMAEGMCHAAVGASVVRRLASVGVDITIHCYVCAEPQGGARH